MLGRRRAWLIAFVLVGASGCGSDETVLSADERSAADDGSEGMAATLHALRMADRFFEFDPTLDPALTADLNAAAVESLLQRELGGCGVVGRTGASVTVSLPPPGCALAPNVTASGMATASIDASAGAVSVTLMLDPGFTINGVAISGTLAFRTTTGSDFDITVDLTLAGAATLAGMLSVRGTAGAMTIDGELTYARPPQSITITITALTMRIGDCYPNAGSFVVSTPGFRIRVTMSASTASTGVAQVAVEGTSRTGTITLPPYGSCPGVAMDAGTIDAGFDAGGVDAGPEADGGADSGVDAGDGGAVEVCDDMADNDGDGLIDCADATCACTAACVDTFLAMHPDVDLLANASFEAGPGSVMVPSFPTATGVWAGDLADVVMTAGGVSPADGSYMMQFMSTYDRPFPTPSTNADQVQLVDVSGFAGRKVCAAARFARVAGDAETDNRFSTIAAWYEGPPSMFDGFASHITTACFSDGHCANGQIEIGPYVDATSWVRATATVQLPPSGTNLTALILLRAYENVHEDTTGDPGPELDGHFADDAVLFVLPED